MGWVFMVIPLLICCLEKKIVLVTEQCILCTGDMCRLGVSIFGGEGKKSYVLTKCVKKKINFCLVGDFPMT